MWVLWGDPRSIKSIFGLLCLSCFKVAVGAPRRHGNSSSKGRGEKKVRLLLNLVGCMCVMRVIIMGEINGAGTREPVASFVCFKKQGLMN